jgi:hypothetical protein
MTSTRGSMTSGMPIDSSTARAMRCSEMTPIWTRTSASRPPTSAWRPIACCSASSVT